MSGALPEQCCSILPSTGELIVIKRGERGYYRSEWNTDSREENKNIADFTNSRMGITPAQLEDAFRIAQSSSFCTGKGKQGWKADFDWLMDENNLVKVLEGKYGGSASPEPSKLTKEERRYQHW